MSRHARLDRVCAEAVDFARTAAEETGEGVGEYSHALSEGDRVVTHFFECTLRGYRGWRWAVVVARAPRSRTVTVSETALLPGPEALTAPEWVPWANRLRGGDVGAGDLLPTEKEDPRLDPAYVYSDDDGLEDLAFELGVGRERVMSREGRIECAERWYDGEAGPNADIATSAPKGARCGSCGFYLQLAGSLRQVFGVCGNFYAADDGKVVSADHGCGAHSEVLSDDPGAGTPDIRHTDTIYDDAAVVDIDTSGPAADPIATVLTSDAETTTSVAVAAEKVNETASAPTVVGAVDTHADSGDSLSEGSDSGAEEASQKPSRETDSDAVGGTASLLAFLLSAFVSDHEQRSGYAQCRTQPRASDPPASAGSRQIRREHRQHERDDEPYRHAAQCQCCQWHIGWGRNGTKWIKWHRENLAFRGLERHVICHESPVHNSRIALETPLCSITVRHGGGAGALWTCVGGIL